MNEPRRNIPPRISTSFKSNEAFAQAEMIARQTARSVASVVSGLRVVTVSDLPLLDALGPDYLVHVEGVSKDGPDPVVSHIDFAGGHVFAKYVQTGDDLALITMFPEPKRPTSDALRSKFSADVVRFVKAHWDTDDRYPASVSTEDALRDLDRLGAGEAVRRCLSDVVERAAVSPVEWGEWVNAQTYTQDEVRFDAWQFWNWLYGGKPFEGASVLSNPETKRRWWFPFGK